MGLKRILSIVIPVVGTIIGAVLTGICDFEDHMPQTEKSSDNEQETE